MEEVGTSMTSLVGKGLKHKLILGTFSLCLGSLCLLLSWLASACSGGWVWLPSRANGGRRAVELRGEGAHGPPSPTGGSSWWRGRGR